MSDNENKVIDVEKKLRDITECSICTDTFQEPKILSCVHTFCRKCLQDFATKLTKGPGDQIPCPICRKEFAIPEDGFDGLAINFFMERLIEIQNILKPSSENIEVCEACPDDNSSNAELFCADCQLRLCGNCHRYHTKSKVTKNHKIITLDAARDVSISTVEKMMTGFCNVHDMKPLEIYCSNCSDTVCTFCFFESHDSHKGSPVASVVGDFQKQIRDNIDSFQHYITTLEQRRTVLEEQKVVFIQNSVDLETDLSRTRDELRALIDEHHNSIVQELNTRRSEGLKQMEMEKDDVETLIASLHSYKTYCEQVTTLGSASNICRSINSLNARADELRNQCDFRRQEFSKPCKMILKKAKPLGSSRSADGNLFGQLQECHEVKAENPDENVGEENSAKDTEKKTQADECNDCECIAGAKSTEVGQSFIKISEANDKSRINEANNVRAELEFERERCRQLEATNLSLVNINEELRTNEEQLNGKIEEMENQNTLLRSIIGRNSKTRQQVRGSIKYEAGLKHVGEVRSISAPDGRFSLICGFAANGRELFVCSEIPNNSSIIEVFDVLTLQFIRRWVPNKVGKVKDLIHGDRNQCLYYLNETAKGEANEIIKVDLYGAEITRWPVGKSTGQLSVTPESNVLLTAWNACQLEEYSSDGLRLNVIPLAWNVGFANVWHAVKLNAKHYVVSHGEPKDQLRRLCIIDVDGNVLCYTSENIDRPFYLQVDSHQNILLVDNKVHWNRNNVTLFNSNLTPVNFTFYIKRVIDDLTRGITEKAVLDESSERVFVLEKLMIFKNPVWIRVSDSVILSAYVVNKK